MNFSWKKIFEIERRTAKNENFQYANIMDKCHYIQLGQVSYAFLFDNKDMLKIFTAYYFSFSHKFFRSPRVLMCRLCVALQ